MLERFKSWEYLCVHCKPIPKQGSSVVINFKNRKAKVRINFEDMVAVEEADERLSKTTWEYGDKFHCYKVPSNSAIPKWSLIKIEVVLLSDMYEIAVFHNFKSAFTIGTFSTKEQAYKFRRKLLRNEYILSIRKIDGDYTTLEVVKAVNVDKTSNLEHRFHLPSRLADGIMLEWYGENYDKSPSKNKNSRK